MDFKQMKPTKPTWLSQISWEENVSANSGTVARVTPKKERKKDREIVVLPIDLSLFLERLNCHKSMGKTLANSSKISSALIQKGGI